MSDIITKQFESTALHFTEDAYFNATEAATLFGKRPVKWLDLQSTKEYLNAFAAYHKKEDIVKVPNLDFDSQDQNVVEGVEGLEPALESAVDPALCGYIVTVRGGKFPGTWLHPKLAVAFARWLSPDFAVWCDARVDELLRGNYEKAISETEMLRSQLQTVRKDLDFKTKQLKDANTQIVLQAGTIEDKDIALRDLENGMQEFLARNSGKKDLAKEIVRIQRDLDVMRRRNRALTGVQKAVEVAFDALGYKAHETFATLNGHLQGSAKEFGYLAEDQFRAHLEFVVDRFQELRSDIERGKLGVPPETAADFLLYKTHNNI